MQNPMAELFEYVWGYEGNQNGDEDEDDNDDNESGIKPVHQPWWWRLDRRREPGRRWNRRCHACCRCSTRSSCPAITKSLQANVEIKNPLTEKNGFAKIAIDFAHSPLWPRRTPPQTWCWTFDTFQSLLCCRFCHIYKIVLLYFFVFCIEPNLSVNCCQMLGLNPLPHMISTCGTVSSLPVSSISWSMISVQIIITN